MEQNKTVTMPLEEYEGLKKDLRLAEETFDKLSLSNGNAVIVDHTSSIGYSYNRSINIMTANDEIERAFTRYYKMPMDKIHRIQSKWWYKLFSLFSNFD